MIVRLYVFQLAFRFGRSSHDCMLFFFSASFQICEKSSHGCMVFQLAFRFG